MNDLNCWESKFELCHYSELLLKKIDKINNKFPFKDQIDLREIKKAIYYAKKYHGNQRRDSGEPYYSHPLAVAELVVPYCFKIDVLITSILHDTLEDTKLTKDTLEYIFDANIANKVEDLTRVKFDHKISSAKVIEQLWLEKKHDLLLIKLFDRIHNLQTIYAKSPEKINSIIEETLKQFISLSLYFRFKDTRLIDVDQKIIELCYQHIPNFSSNSDLTFEDSFQLSFLDIKNAL